MAACLVARRAVFDYYGAGRSAAEIVAKAHFRIGRPEPDPEQRDHSPMRLSDTQIAAIRQAVREVYGGSARVWLFGSRVDDDRLGGDIDLLIHPDQPDPDGGLLRKIRFLGKLERTIGECKVDVIVETTDDPRPIVRVAHERGVRL